MTGAPIPPMLDGMDLSDLDRHGAARLPALLTPAQCAAIVALWDDPAAFRKEVVMQRHGYGSGCYRYFAYPLPEPVAALRDALYPALAEVANRWAAMLGSGDIYPARHADFLARCALAGQDKPTPLLLRYEAGDWNALHQDVYGPQIFPIQAAVLLSEPDSDFTGGAFLLTEQRPRMQSRPEVVPLRHGDAVIFPVRERPVPGARGAHRVQMRHGVSRLLSGVRHMLGIIFHDAA
ncbi:2OG-Fe(II) oxygenase [Sphingobium ummariense]|uniref:Prolyl 4-hydroxylase n=1 Tax=Sphingobium ummariense RL-3 TaxID=1346791 RepID=T0KJ76_9SPHN|nr:2OG-Fe(II) oxygenase [Sphingobium ummariense]EQB33348.1 prolyl 4-hydroxylase [Sphingobium ummariense RL-3]